MKTVATKPAPRFAIGATVVVVGAVNLRHNGLVCKVTGYIWAKAGGGQPAGWACKTDLPDTRGPVVLFERLLTPA